MKHTILLVLIVFVTALCLSLAEAQPKIPLPGSLVVVPTDGWIKKSSIFHPTIDGPRNKIVYGTGFIRKKEYAFGVSIGSTTVGNAEAYTFDYIWGSASEATVAVGMEEENWIYPKGKGTVEVSGAVFIRGFANLINPSCAAAALGYSENYNSVTGTTIVHLKKSAGETIANQLGELQLGKKGIGSVHLKISIGNGAGPYPDYDMSYFNGSKKLDKYRVYHKTRAYDKVWSRDLWPLSTSHCTAETQGSVFSFTYLLQ